MTVTLFLLFVYSLGKFCLFCSAAFSLLVVSVCVAANLSAVRTKREAGVCASPSFFAVRRRKRERERGKKLVPMCWRGLSGPKVKESPNLKPEPLQQCK